MDDDIYDRPLLLVTNNGDGFWPRAGAAEEVLPMLAHFQEIKDHEDVGAPPVVYRFDSDGKPVETAVEVSPVEYDADEWGHGTVTVTWPDEAMASATYRVDGRS